MAEEIKRIAAMADVHVQENDKGKWSPIFKSASAAADVLLICGDLTNTGDEMEAEVLASELSACTIPVIAVLGNHDYEKNRHKLIRQALVKQQVHILDGESVVIGDTGFAGVKGFGGGFDNHMLSMFGEGAMKAFVQEAVDETLHLERALARLAAQPEVRKKIVLLHYSPASETVKGEPEVIYPFLGSSRLAEPLNGREVVAAFHGHAHHGSFECTTKSGVKIYNVSVPVLLKQGYDPPFFVFEIN
jgi:Icc-related predicted phosphoesterase